jgi:hypothetical protein
MSPARKLTTAVFLASLAWFALLGIVTFAGWLL